METSHVLATLAGLALGSTIAFLAQERRVSAAQRDDTYGMLTRQGGLARLSRLRGAVDIVFLDIDHMHDANAQLGYEEVNRRLRAAFQIRRSDALLLCRWFSGDEILAVTRPGDGAGLAERLHVRMRALGLSATIGVVSGAGYAQAIERATAIVGAAKAAGQRGVVVRSEEA